VRSSAFGDMQWDDMEIERRIKSEKTLDDVIFMIALVAVFRRRGR
jgi:hypothetical protein